jgi:hypothetical protein
MPYGSESFWWRDAELQVRLTVVRLVIGVYDVGDGFTGLLGNETDIGASSVLVDFGGESGGSAVDALYRVHGPRWWPWLRVRRPLAPPPFDAFVLSHPHADHFNGLRIFRGRREREPWPPLLKSGAPFYHPGLPRNPVVAEFALRFAAAQELILGGPQFTPSQELSGCMESPVLPSPLFRGQWVDLADQRFKVLWPPEQLPPDATERLVNLVERYDSFAEGDGALQEAIERYRKRMESDNDPLYGLVDEAPHDSPRPEAREREHPRRPHAESPDETRLKALEGLIRNGANLLSLALMREDGSYAFLGDLDKSLHDQIARDLVGCDLRVLSSAHHGTHFGPALTDIHSDYVLSSVGKKRKGNIAAAYAEMGVHLRTDQVGDISVMLTDSGRISVWAEKRRWPVAVR